MAIKVQPRAHTNPEGYDRDPIPGKIRLNTEQPVHFDAVKTAVGDVHLTQSAYLTKLQRTKTRLDGTLTLGVTDPRDEAIEEA